MFTFDFVFTLHSFIDNKIVLIIRKFHYNSLLNQFFFIYSFWLNNFAIQSRICVFNYHCVFFFFSVISLWIICFIQMPVRLCACVCMSVCLSVCLSICMSVCLHVFLSTPRRGKTARPILIKLYTHSFEKKWKKTRFLIFRNVVSLTWGRSFWIFYAAPASLKCCAIFF